MLGLRRILDWIIENVKPMRLYRQKTLAAIVHSALHLRGIGVLSLGRGLPGNTSPKHGIKRVRRFFRNGQLEIDSLQLSLAHLMAPRNAPVVILLDWTVYGPFQTLAAALPRDGRTMPVRWKTICVKNGDWDLPTPGWSCLKKKIGAGAYWYWPISSSRYLAHQLKHQDWIG